MRTIPSPTVVLPAFLLVLCFTLGIGCQRSQPGQNLAPDKDTSPVPAAIPPNNKTPDNKSEPLIIPLEPRVDTPEEKKEEPHSMPGISAVSADVFGKYAAETVPLPPLDDLVAQIDEYITKIGSNLDDLDGSPRYAEDATDIVRDTNALSLIALALGLAESESKYKQSASNIIVAAKNLAAAKKFEDGKKEYAALKASLTNPAAGTPLAWSDKVADLTPMMKALPNLSSAVKRATDTEMKLNRTLDRKPQPIYSQLAALAVISQGSIPNVSETTKPEATAEWKKFCEEFRNAALQVNAVAHQFAKDKADGKDPGYADFNTSFKAMSESCDHCHKVFHPNAVGKE